ncbi:hypothetical protein VTO73DRAFT_12971 [Trametes versicolor]
MPNAAKRSRDLCERVQENRVFVDVFADLIPPRLRSISRFTNDEEAFCDPGKDVDDLSAPLSFSFPRSIRVLLPPAVALHPADHNAIPKTKHASLLHPRLMDDQQRRERCIAAVVIVTLCRGAHGRAAQALGARVMVDDERAYACSCRVRSATQHGQPSSIGASLEPRMTLLSFEYRTNEARHDETNLAWGVTYSQTPSARCRCPIHSTMSIEARRGATHKFQATVRHFPSPGMLECAPAGIPETHHIL